jgi:hypothetical protein
MIGPLPMIKTDFIELSRGMVRRGCYLYKKRRYWQYIAEEMKPVTQNN